MTSVCWTHRHAQHEWIKNPACVKVCKCVCLVFRRSSAPARSAAELIHLTVPVQQSIHSHWQHNTLSLSLMRDSINPHTHRTVRHSLQPTAVSTAHTHTHLQAEMLIHAAISCHTSHSLSLSVQLSVSGVWRKCWVCLCKTHHQHARVSTDNWLLRCSECFLSCCYAVVRMGYWATIKRVLPELWYSGIIVGYLGPYEICFIFSPDTILFFSGFRFNGLIWFFVKFNHFRAKIVSK